MPWASMPAAARWEPNRLRKGIGRGSACCWTNTAPRRAGRPASPSPRSRISSARTAAERPASELVATPAARRQFRSTPPGARFRRRSPWAQQSRPGRYAEGQDVGVLDDDGDQRPVPEDDGTEDARSHQGDDEPGRLVGDATTGHEPSLDRDARIRGGWGADGVDHVAAIDGKHPTATSARHVRGRRRHEPVP